MGTRKQMVQKISVRVHVLEGGQTSFGKGPISQIARDLLVLKGQDFSTAASRQMGRTSSRILSIRI